MSGDQEELWTVLPEKVLHPLRILILEALRWISEPLSALDLVDVLDGQGITMWEAEHHLRSLERLGVVKAFPAGRDRRAPRDAFHLPYRLTILDSGEAP